MVNMILLLFVAVAFAIDPEDLIVQLPKGKIRGQILKSYTEKSYYAFQEIPYAAPPIGNNRFQLPKQPEAWQGVLNTTKNTVACYQEKTRFPNLKLSEDCLYLNVYTPVKPGSAKLLPVYLWIHGGGYVVDAGTFEFYGPQYIMDHGEVVIVSINYRLGVFGFLTAEDDVIPGNLGLKDQRLAMEWVHDNIHLFGGNKSSVTIGGESAGAGAVGLHLLGKWGKSRELFHAAIMQSGHPIWAAFINRGRDAAFAVGKTLSKDFASNNTKELLAVLQKASTTDIFKANVSSAWAPIIEKEGDFSYPMLQALMDGNFKYVPIIIGFNSEEWIWRAQDKDMSSKASAMDNDPTLVLNKLLNMSNENRTIAAKLLRTIYTNSSFKEDLGAYIRYSSDRDFSTPIMKMAELECPHTDVYVYRFAYKGPLGGQMQLPIVPGAERVGHAEDIHYMWNDGGNNNLTSYSVADQLMFHRYMRLWLNFIKYHNPTPIKDQLLQNLTWPKLENAKDIQINFLNMNVSMEIQQNPRNYKQNKQVLDKYILPPYIYY